MLDVPTALNIRETTHSFRGQMLFDISEQT